VAHRVGLWTGDGAFLASASVPAGTGAEWEQGYRYVPAAPLALQPERYVIGKA